MKIENITKISIKIMSKFRRPTCSGVCSGGNARLLKRSKSKLEKAAGHQPPGHPHWLSAWTASTFWSPVLGGCWTAPWPPRGGGGRAGRL